MTVYTYWSNKDPEDGTAALIVRSGKIYIGQSGDLTNAEYSLLARQHVFLPGQVWGWTPEAIKFAWGTDLYYPYQLGQEQAGNTLIYSWKTPGVDTFANLPFIGNTENDVRMTLDTQTLYVWDGSTWQLLADYEPVPFSMPLDGGTASSTFEGIVDGGSYGSVPSIIVDGGTT